MLFINQTTISCKWRAIIGLKKMCFMTTTSYDRTPLGPLPRRNYMKDRKRVHMML